MFPCMRRQAALVRRGASGLPQPCEAATMRVCATIGAGKRAGDLEGVSSPRPRHQVQ
jgi:hypothetical protein